MLNIICLKCMVIPSSMCCSPTEFQIVINNQYFKGNCSWHFQKLKTSGNDGLPTRHVTIFFTNKPLHF